MSRHRPVRRQQGQGPSALLTLFTLATATPSFADRAATLVAGPELRLRAPKPDDPGRYEVGLPLGVSSADGRAAFVTRVGMLLPTDDGPLALPVSIGTRFVPGSTRVRALLGTDLGGYLVRAPGPQPTDAPGGPQWCWSLRALAGVELGLTRRTTIVLYADAMWVQQPRDERSRAHLASALGLGLELRLRFAPRLRLIDMFLHGTRAPEAF